VKILKKIKILYIEDELFTAEQMVDFLEDEGFRVFHVDSVVDALAMVKTQTFDIALLDLNLGDYVGFEFLKNLKLSKKLPVIVLSALSDTATKVQAFRYGASDYMVKPVDLLELEARIWAVLGRFSEIDDKDDKREIFYKQDEQIYKYDEIIDLTPTEYDIFDLLLSHKNQTLKRESILEHISGIGNHRSLDYHIKNIRSKIEEDPKNPKYLKTVYGVGYKLVF